MRAVDIVGRVRAAVESKLQERGVELVDVEYRREPVGEVLRLYIDKAGGVNLEICSDVSSVVGDELERTGALKGPYSLEVSSPGVERRLTRPEHYERFVGSEIVVKTKQPRSGQRKFAGELREADGTGFILSVEGSSLRFEYTEISKANLIFKDW